MTATIDFSQQAGRIKFEKDSVSLLIQGARSFYSYYISRDNPAQSEENVMTHWKNPLSDLFIREFENDARHLFTRDEGYELGMNSPGILWDRITILICKLVIKSPTYIKQCKATPSSGPTDVNEQIADILTVLHSSLPAKSILLAKEQTERVRNPPSLAESLGVLMKSNIGMWLNQDLLYTKDPQSVPTTRLQTYIALFAVYNSERNRAIEEIEISYRRILRG